jgi:hypothetical protein
MTVYNDPAKIYMLEYPDGWLPLTQEGCPHVSLASLTTGGYLKVEAYQIEQPAVAEMRPERVLQALLACEKRAWPEIGEPRIACGTRNGAASAYLTYTRPEAGGKMEVNDFGHVRAWAFTRGSMQVRCLFRCRSVDAGTDDDELNSIINSLVIDPSQHLDASKFTSYYFNVLKLRRPQMVSAPPNGLTLQLADGQTILLEHLFNHYRQEPDRIDELIDTHINLLDFCGDDVPDLSNFELVKPLLFPKVFRAVSNQIPSHRMRLWPGLLLGAVVQGSVFNYGVNSERLRSWGIRSLSEIGDLLLENLYAIPPVTPRGLKDEDGGTVAISYVDHPFCASFVLYEDFYETTAENLGTSEFLVGLPDPSCVSCFRCDDPRFVVQHTALLRWDYHRSVERLTDTVYLVTGPRASDVKPYDILHACAKSES